MAGNSTSPPEAASAISKQEASIRSALDADIVDRIASSRPSGMVEAATTGEVELSFTVTTIDGVLMTDLVRYMERIEAQLDADVGLNADRTVQVEMHRRL